MALHEAGHAIGLGHSDKPGNIMYPYYHLGVQLAADDIAGAVDLYGAAGPAFLPSSDVPLVTAVKPAVILTVTNAPATSVDAAHASALLAGTSSGGTGSIAVTWQTDHGDAGKASGSSANWTIGPVALLSGQNTITVTAIDSAHQTAVKAVQVTVRALAGGPDTTNPTLSVTVPAATIVSTNAASFAMRGTASDNVAVTKVTWQNSIYATGLASGTGDWSAENIPLYPGNNNLIIRAYDAAGNMSWRSITVVRR